MFDFLKRFQKQYEPVSENPKPVIPKEPQKTKAEIYLEQNPIRSDYKLTAGDLSSISDYLMYMRRICNVDAQVGYVDGHLLSLIIKLKTTLDNQKIEL